MPIPQTRRDLLRLSLLLTPVPSLFAASDFWNKKPSTEWSDAEIVQLKTKSPWAKKVSAEMAGGMGGSRGGGGSDGMGMGDSEGGGGGGRGGGGGGGGRGGGGGGRGGEGGGGQSMPMVELVVRWESAKPILETTKLKLPPSFDDHYAISVTGLPQRLLTSALSGGGGRGRGRGADTEQPPEDPAARQKAAVDRLLHSATLSAKAKDPEVADLVVQTGDKQTLIFGFSSHTLPLAAGDKDVQFTMKLGAMTLKAKFDPKEMTYKGELTL